MLAITPLRALMASLHRCAADALHRVVLVLSSVSFRSAASLSPGVPGVFPPGKTREPTEDCAASLTLTENTLFLDILRRQRALKPQTMHFLVVNRVFSLKFSFGELSNLHADRVMRKEFLNIVDVLEMWTQTLLVPKPQKTPELSSWHARSTRHMLRD